MLRKFLHIFIIVFSLVAFVSCGEETSLTTISAELGYILPDLTGYTKSEIETELDDLDISYVWGYQTTEDVAEDLFVSYDSFSSGDTITGDQVVVVILSTNKLVLPDLTGMTQSEILMEMLTKGIDFVLEVVTDNDVENETFSSYEDPFEAGSLISNAYTITIYIGYNQTKLPDLSGMIVEEIEKTLSDLNISYEFEYIVNDDFTEDTFVNYKDASAGDYYEDGVVTINLYQNTFTNNATSLIISKYIDGGDDTSNQAIELFNATSSDIDLSEYHLVIYKNGSLEITYTIQLESEILEPGETYVIANASADANILIKTDLSTSDLIFDGNDTIQLCYSNGTYIDTIYQIGDNALVMDNEVFVRSTEVVSGTRDYTYSEWYGFIPTYVESLGSHPVTLPETFSIEITSRGFDSPLGGMDLVSLVYTNDGDTASFNPGFLDSERVRFLGTDTPETFYPEVQDWGFEAKDYTTTILEAATKIYVQSDPDLGYEDTFGRHLGLIWAYLGDSGITLNHYDLEGTLLRTEHLSGWVLVNYQIVLNGYSYNYYSSESNISFENRYIYRWFEEAEDYAEENGYGIHS